MFYKRIIILFLIIAGFTAAASAQDVKLAPVYPEGSSGLIFIEGEDAVSTNFANQAVSNFGCSGYQAVQLNRSTGLQGGAAFYAEFVFYAEEAGEYEFWYGGTPPGPLDELSPSYASPFSVVLDGGESRKIYRENMNVVEGYSPSYYWNKCGVFSLSEGTHRLRIEVADKRAYDGRYFFYLDNLFFLNREKIKEIAEVKPEVFPSSLESSIIDNPFLSVTEYQNYIDANPDDMNAYIELSLVFSLVGDYQGALKTLNKAMALDASDPYPIVLAAKNRLWKGDVRESLTLYERALTVDPSDSVLWGEAGKVAAWSAEYDKSISFFSRGLEHFPTDMNLMVNLALTYLWMARDLDAEQTFASALAAAEAEPELLSALGQIEEAAGYPDYARDVYLKSIDLYPEYLEFYLLLQASYLGSGERAAADEVAGLIGSTFRASEQLNSQLDIYSKKLSLRDEVINSYLKRLEQEPGNLELRQELAQTFFWNGMRTEAIEQIRLVITTYGYQAAETFGRRSSDVLSLADLAASIAPFFADFESRAGAVDRGIGSSLSALNKAVKTEESAAGGEAAEAVDARAALRKAEQDYADAVEAARGLSALMESYTALLEDYRGRTAELLAAEKTEDEAFRSVIQSSGWEWAKDRQTEELTGILEDERTLASFMLGRIYFGDRHFSRAAGVLLPDADTGAVVIEPAPAGDEAEASGTAAAYDLTALEAGPLYTLYQVLLHGGETAETAGLRSRIALEAAGRLAADFPHLQQTEQQLTEAADPLAESPAGVYYDGLIDESAEVIETLSGHADNAAAQYKALAVLQNQLFAVIEKRLERANYYLEADTFLIRYELGNYYLEEGQNREAAEQFRRVIAVDPWNISAVYKLGVVEQRYGDWSEAMKYYKKVYYQDSTYENAVNYYNQIAREHADKVVTELGVTCSPAEIAVSGRLEYQTEFNSMLGFGLNYNLDQERQYRDYEGQEQGAFQLHLFEAQFPLTFGGIGLEVTPKGGVYAESIYFKTDYSFPDDDSVSMSEFLQTISTYPEYGLAAQWVYGPLTLDAGWVNAIEPDTVYADRSMLRKDDISLNANTWFSMDDSDLLGPLTTRTYGRMQLMGDGNIKWQAYQDVMLGFTLLSSPIIKLSPAASVNFETSNYDEVSGYYAPNRVLEAKGILRSAFTFPSSDWSRAFEAVLWGGAGGYWTDFGESEQSDSLKVEGGIGTTYVKDGSMYYLNGSASGTFIDGENDYWEIGITFGTNLSLPGLLAP